MGPEYGSFTPRGELENWLSSTSIFAARVGELELDRIGPAGLTGVDRLRVVHGRQEAADIARRLGAPEHLARAALEFEQTTWVARLPTTPAVHLLEEALQALGDTESALRARTLGSLARALLYTGLQQQAAVCAEQAVAMARRVNDPAALSFNLDVMLDVPWGPEQTEARLSDVMEELQVQSLPEDDPRRAAKPPTPASPPPTPAKPESDHA